MARPRAMAGPARRQGRVPVRRPHGIRGGCSPGRRADALGCAGRGRRRARRRRGAGAGSAPQSASWSDAPPPPDTAPSWASPLELAKATVAVETEAAAAPERVVDDTAISDDDESIDDLTDVGVPVVERILGGTVIAEDSR